MDYFNNIFHISGFSFHLRVFSSFSQFEDYKSLYELALCFFFGIIVLTFALGRVDKDHIYVDMSSFNLPEFTEHCNQGDKELSRMLMKVTKG